MIDRVEFMNSPHVAGNDGPDQEAVRGNLQQGGGAFSERSRRSTPRMAHSQCEAALKATAALCAEMVGGGEWVLETSINYAKERKAFGVPIGSFQAIKHKCADMYSGLEYARSLMEWAAETINDGSSDASRAVAMAKSYCGDVYKMVCDQGVQIHGGIGFTWDHDMHLYFKRARSLRQALRTSSRLRSVRRSSGGGVSLNCTKAEVASHLVSYRTSSKSWQRTMEAILATADGQLAATLKMA